MLTSATSLGRSGLQDWLIQRMSAIFLAGYFGFLFFYIGINQPLVYDEWLILFANPFMQFFSLLTLLSLMMHAWIGFWTVSTDYLKPAAIRLPIQVFMVLFLLANVLWGFSILWGI